MTNLHSACRDDSGHLIRISHKRDREEKEEEQNKCLTRCCQEVCQSEITGLHNIYQSNLNSLLFSPFPFKVYRCANSTQRSFQVSDLSCASLTFTFCFCKVIHPDLQSILSLPSSLWANRLNTNGEMQDLCMTITMIRSQIKELCSIFTESTPRPIQSISTDAKFTKTQMSPKRKFHQITNVSKSQMSPKCKCHQTQM